MSWKQKMRQHRNREAMTAPDVFIECFTSLLEEARRQFNDEEYADVVSRMAPIIRRLHVRKDEPTCDPLS